MSFLQSLAVLTSQSHALEMGRISMARPMFGLLALFPILFGIIIVAALVFVAWKVGTYYDALRKKL